MARKKDRKLVIFILILAIVFIIFVYFLKRRHDYTLKYEVSEIFVEEKYHKEESYYSFHITYNDSVYEVISFSKYQSKRKLISDIEINGDCLSFVSSIELYDVCKNENGYYYKEGNNSFEEKSSYKNVSIANLFDYTFYLWDYHEFIYLNKDTKKTINLFSKDIYNLNLIYQTDDTLVVPNYNETYEFSKVYLLKVSGKVKDFSLRYKVYFDSYFLGDTENLVYLYDKKNEEEYYLDLKKEDIYKTSYKILNNDKWEKVTNQSLKNKNMSFKKDKIFNYELIDNKLYGMYDTKYLVTNKDVSKIIKVNNLDVFYIAKDTLYYFNPLKGEVPLLKYSEWEFNNNNMVFIFNN